MLRLVALFIATKWEAFRTALCGKNVSNLHKHRSRGDVSQTRIEVNV